MYSELFPNLEWKGLAQRSRVRPWVRRLGAALVTFAVLTAGAAQAEALVEEVVFMARSDGQGYVVRVRTADTIKAYGMPRMAGERQLEWVLYDTRLADDFAKRPPDGPIRNYTTKNRDGHLILQFHLEKGQSVNAEAYRDQASSDLLMNLVYVTDPPVAEAQRRSGGGASSSGTVQQVTSSPSGPLNGVSREARERWQLDTVIIDPGHGGKDPGATAHGLQEKDVVLSVAHKLGDYIENRLGIDVVYTRTDDEFIPLEERGHMANEAGAKLFLSLHVNASRQRAARGTETYFLGPSKTQEAEKVMERENSVIKYEEDTERYEDYDEGALVRRTLTHSSFMRQSERLASIVQTEFEERVNRHNRGVHQAGFYVLWSASMPSVLVELGFLTNSKEARFLKSDQGQTYLASAIFRAVRSYKTTYEKGIFASE